MFQDEAAYSQLENSFLQQQFPLNSNTSVGNYIKNSDFQSYSPSTYLFSENAIKDKLDLGLELEKRYEHEDDQLSNVKEEGYTLDGSSDDCGELVKNDVSDGFFRLLIYNEKEEQSCHQSQYVKEPTMRNKQRDHKEGDEDSQWDVSLNLSNLETFCEEDIFLLNLVEEQNDIPLEVLEKNGVVNVEILNEVVDISLKNNHENSFQRLF